MPGIFEMNATPKIKGGSILFAPHPDDETLGCGGFLARRIDEGNRMFVVVLTMGEKLFSSVLNIEDDPSPAEVCVIRREETKRATRILGLKPENLLFLDYEDGSLERQQHAVVERLVPILRDESPIEVVCTSEYEGHRDHIATNEIVRRACARVGAETAIRHYITSLKQGVSIDRLPGRIDIVDVRAYLPLKRKAIEQFQSHLGILSKRQTKPLDNFNRYLSGEETFIISQGCPHDQA